MEDEVWKEVPLHPAYEVSTLGRVRRKLPGRGARVGGILKVTDNGKGYLWVKLERRKKEYVHRIVTTTFHGLPPSAKHEAAHSNGIRSDNRAGNLSWKTCKANHEDKRIHGTARVQVGETNVNSRLTEKDIMEIRRLRSDGLGFLEIGDRFGIDRSTAGGICSGRRWKHV